MAASSSTQTLRPLFTSLSLAVSLKPSQQQSVPSTHTPHYTLAAKRTIGRKGSGGGQEEIGRIDIKAVSLGLASSSVMICLEKWVSASAPRHK